MSAGNIVRPARAGSQDTFAMPGTGVLDGSPSCQIGMQLLAGLASVGAKAALAAGATAWSSSCPPAPSNDTQVEVNEADAPPSPHSHAHTALGWVERGSSTWTSAPSDAGKDTLTHTPQPPSVEAAQAAEVTPARDRHTADPRGASSNHGIGATDLRPPDDGANGSIPPIPNTAEPTDPPYICADNAARQPCAFARGKRRAYNVIQRPDTHS